MLLPGSHQRERYEQMEADVSIRRVEWHLYRSNKVPIDPVLNQIVSMLKKDFLNVGPFGHHFVKDHPHQYKSHFYDIPLQHTYADTTIHQFESIAYVATSAEASILLKSIHDYFRVSHQSAEFEALGVMAICVQTAFNHQEERNVVALDCIEHLQPLAYYEHPANGRLLQAFSNQDPPDQSALLFHGKHRTSTVHLHKALTDATYLYNELDNGNIQPQELTDQLFTYFTKS